VPPSRSDCCEALTEAAERQGIRLPGHCAAVDGSKVILKYTLWTSCTAITYLIASAFHMVACTLTDLAQQRRLHPRTRVPPLAVRNTSSVTDVISSTLWDQR
jgi:hypothetical protein